MASFVATIGSSDFLVGSLADAEQLLRILSAATLVDESYVGSDEAGSGSRYVLHKADGEKRVSVKLADSEPISYAEYTKLRAAASKAARDRRADAGEAA